MAFPSDSRYVWRLLTWQTFQVVITDESCRYHSVLIWDVGMLVQSLDPLHSLKGSQISTLEDDFSSAWQAHPQTDSWKIGLWKTPQRWQMISERNINLEFQVFVWRIGKRSQSLSNILSIVPAWDSSKSSSLFSIISMVSLGYTPQLDPQKQTNKQPAWSCAKRCEQSLKVFQNRLRLYQGFILHSWSFKKKLEPFSKKRKRDLLFQPSFFGCYVATFWGV